MPYFPPLQSGWAGLTMVYLPMSFPYHMILNSNCEALLFRDGSVLTHYMYGGGGGGGGGMPRVK